MNTITLRKHIKQQRRALTYRQRTRFATLASLHLPSIAKILPKKAHIGLYQDAFGELPTHTILQFCQKFGYTPYLPVIAGNCLQFTPILPKACTKSAATFNSLPHKRHRLGMAEPIGNHIGVSRLHAVFCPLVAIDKYGNRMGMGGGFYDRSLRQYHGIKIGYCYDFQVIEHIAKNPWDIGMDFILTPKQLIRC